MQGRRFKTLNEKAIIDLRSALSSYDGVDLNTIDRYAQNALHISNLSSMNMNMLAGAYMYQQYSRARPDPETGQYQDVLNLSAWNEVKGKIIPSVSAESVILETQTALYRYLQRIRANS